MIILPSELRKAQPTDRLRLAAFLGLPPALAADSAEALNALAMVANGGSPHTASCLCNECAYAYPNAPFNECL